jgi:hypothetical protein
MHRVASRRIGLYGHAKDREPVEKNSSRKKRLQFAAASSHAILQVMTPRFPKVQNLAINLCIVEYHLPSTGSHPLVWRMIFGLRRSEIAPIIETRCGAFGMEVPSTMRGRTDHRDLKAALNLE